MWLRTLGTAATNLSASKGGVAVCRWLIRNDWRRRKSTNESAVAVFQNGTPLWPSRLSDALSFANGCHSFGRSGNLVSRLSPSRKPRSNDIICHAAAEHRRTSSWPGCGRALDDPEARYEGPQRDNVAIELPSGRRHSHAASGPLIAKMFSIPLWSRPAHVVVPRFIAISGKRNVRSPRVTTRRKRTTGSSHKEGRLIFRPRYESKSSPISHLDRTDLDQARVRPYRKSRRFSAYAYKCVIGTQVRHHPAARLYVSLMPGDTDPSRIPMALWSHYPC